MNVSLHSEDVDGNRINARSTDNEERSNVTLSESADLNGDGPISRRQLGDKVLLLLWLVGEEFLHETDENREQRRGEKEAGI